MTVKFYLFIFAFMVSIMPTHAQGHRHKTNKRPNSHYYDQSYASVIIPSIPYLTAKQQHKIENICMDQQKKLNRLNSERSITQIQLQQAQISSYSKSGALINLRKKLYAIDEEIVKVNYKAEQKIYSVLNRHQQVAYMSQKDSKPYRGRN